MGWAALPTFLVCAGIEFEGSFASAHHRQMPTLLLRQRRRFADSGVRAFSLRSVVRPPSGLAWLPFERVGLLEAARSNPHSPVR
jgi:hypothetical protein